MKIIFSPRKSGKTAYAISWVRGESDRSYAQKDLKKRAIIVFNIEEKMRLIKMFKLEDNQVYTFREALGEKGKSKIFFIDNAETILERMFNNVDIITMSNDEGEAIITTKVKRPNY